MRKHQVFWFLIRSIVFFDIEASRIPLGSKLSVAEQNNWTSPDGNFAIGFFNRSDQPNRFGVGIRFGSISIPPSEQALVWVAGAHVSVGYDSFLQLDEAGDLVLFDPSQGDAVWRSNTRNSSVSWAGLRDDGNLLLFNIHQDVVWQSFDTPSDTLLPGQNFTLLRTLRAASSNVVVSSYYGLFMDASGQLRLTWETDVTYWKTEATSSEPIFVSIFTREGAFQLLDMRSRPVWSRFGDDHHDSSVSFRFLRLDSDGNLRMYSWTGGSDSWRKVWQAVENQCDVFATCGLSGICAFTPSGDTTCRCPFGGSSSDSSSKCLASDDRTCDAGSIMIALEHTLLYGIYPPEDFITRSGIELCRNSCLRDPHCTSVTVSNDGEAWCRMRRTRFVTGHEHPSLTSISFVKVCIDPFPVPLEKVHAPLPSSSSKRSSGLHMSSVVVLASGALIVFLVLQIGAFLYFLKRRKAIKSLGAARYPCWSSVGLISLSYSEMEDMTCNFKHQLGLNLHKGVLPIDRVVVVVKELKYDMECGDNMGEKQFRSWILALGGIHHKNLVRLLAYSCNSGRRFLVYEFIKNASVDKWLKDAKLSRRLTWRKRMEICIGVARALAYLHSGCREFVSHGNLKWGNVLLNEQLEAKLTEFGLERVRGNASQDSQGAEMDVARFGEMIVIMVSGHQGGADVCGWAYKEWVEGCAVRVVDSRIGRKFDVEEVERMLRVAFWCIQTDARLRPMMGEVLKVLEGTLSVDPPPPPYPCLKPLEESHSIQ